MDRNFRNKLTVIFISFTLLISLVIILADYQKLKSNVEKNLDIRIQMAEDEIITALSTIDKVYNLLDLDQTWQMEGYSITLKEKYEENPDFSSWDFDALKKELDMDVFIIDEHNVVVESSYKDDIGLDFDECCRNFGKLLTERRESGVFSYDSLDIHQNTGEFKKFSYLPTSDRKYLIELSYYLEDKAVFKEFNFMDTTHRLEEENDQIKSIRVYNSLGLLLGEKMKGGKNNRIESFKKDVFNESFKQFASREMTVKENGQLLTYRYIPYRASHAQGLSTNRVVEIAYYEVPFSQVLSSFQKQFIFQLIGITVITVLLSFLLVRIISKPVHLAFHDVLTGLKNRAAFEDTAVEWLRRKETPLHFMIIDLDNFKSVNDLFGHGEGDRILRQAAHIIKEESGHNHLAARIGGDEFVVLFSDHLEQEVLEHAEHMLDSMRKAFGYLQQENIRLSISIGIAKAERDDTIQSLYTKADLALYDAKKKGKDRFSFYNADKQENRPD